MKRLGYTKSQVTADVLITFESSDSYVTLETIHFDKEETTANLKIDFDVCPKAKPSELVHLKIDKCIGDFWPIADKSCAECVIEVLRGIIRIRAFRF